MRILRVLFVAAALAAGACTVSLTVEASLYAKPTTYVVATEPPPPLREDVDPGTPPTSASVWVEGHWSWNGRWEWTPGAWKEPRPDHVWEPPVCVVEDGRYEYFPGYFRPRTELPPPVYREPGHVQLHVPAPNVRPNTELPDRIVVRPGVDIPDTTGPGTTGPATVTPGTDVSTDVGTVGGGVSTNPTLPEGTDLGGGTTTEQTPPPEENVAPALSCSLTIARVPRRTARFSVRGTGFDQSVVVQVGGTLQTVRSFTETSIDVQTDRAGEVVVVRGEERVSCGRLELF